MVELEQFMINMVKYYGDSCWVTISQIGEDNYRYRLSSRGTFISRSRVERLLLYEQSEVNKRIDEELEETFREDSLSRENDTSTYLDAKLQFL